MDSRPLIVEIHIQVKAGAWSRVYEQIREILRKDQSCYCLTPLYLTHDIEDTEIRICFHLKDPAKLEEFVVNELRSIEGVYGTRARLTLDGEIFPTGLVALARNEQSLKSSHVFLKVDPLRDSYVWDALRQLKDSDGVSPTWIFRDFYEYDRDITLRLVGKSEGAIRQYVEQHVAIIEGIVVWRLQFMHGMTQILPTDRLLILAQQWMPS